MTAQEKAPFQNQAEVDKQRFNNEMRTYVPQDSGRKRGGKRKRSKDPNAPKRSLSAFFWFCNDERPKIRGMNPEYTVGDVAKELGRMWAQVDPQTRERYNLMAERDKQRYQRVSLLQKTRVLLVGYLDKVLFHIHDSLYFICRKWRVTRTTRRQVVAEVSHSSMTKKNLRRNLMRKMTSKLNIISKVYKSIHFS